MTVRWHQLCIFIVCAMIMHPARPLAEEALPARCQQEPLRGPCKAVMEKFYFNLTTGRCASFIYGGCGLVAPFNTLEECRNTCEILPPVKKRDSSGLYYDSIEDDPRYTDIFNSIDSEVYATLGISAKNSGRGHIHQIWDTKKRILKWKYKLDWRTPAELNPHVMFD